MEKLMGGISFSAQVLPDILSEVAGYKAGLTLSVEQMCDLFSGSEYPDLIRRGEEFGVRLRSEEYEDLFYSLLHRIGHTEEKYDGPMVESARLLHKYKGNDAKLFSKVTDLFLKKWPELVEAALKTEAKEFDPTPLLIEAKKRYGKTGLEMMYERILVMIRASTYSPHSAPRFDEWHSTIPLDGLFDGNAPKPEHGTYIDQRYINFLSNNPEKLGLMHWRKFEELTTEFFLREGYQVELGPGSNDDGVDVRLWDPNENISNPPLCIVQCKRTKNSVEKVVVKGLFSDIVYNQAKRGLIVTTSELSPGARTTITSRGYPIEEVNNVGIMQWLKKLRTTGTGIVRV
jgi:restriction system protein